MEKKQILKTKKIRKQKNINTLDKYLPKKIQIPPKLPIINQQPTNTITIDKQQPYVVNAQLLLQQFHQQELGNTKKKISMKLHQKWNTSQVKHLKHNYFLNKKILDIGCNQGIITLQLAIKYFPKLIKGIDIDKKFILEAEKNKKFFEMNNMGHQIKLLQQESIHSQPLTQQLDKILARISKLPQCFIKRIQKDNQNIQTNSKKLYQLITTTNLVPKKPKNIYQNKFPNNIQFITQNFFQLSHNQKYDTILALSFTKYIHLSFGDPIIIKFFTQVFQMLNPGGHFIMNSYTFKCYKRIKNKNKIYGQNFKSIKLQPGKFIYLLKEIGFELIEKIEIDSNELLPLKKPIYIYKKPIKR